MALQPKPPIGQKPPTIPAQPLLRPNAPLLKTGSGGGSLNSTPNSGRVILQTIGSRLAQLVKLNTLAGQFTSLALIGAALAMLASIAATSVITTQVENFDEVIKKSAPGLVAAQDLSQALSNLDTSAVSLQVATRVDISSPDYDRDIYGLQGIRSQILGLYDRSVNDFSDALFRARANIASQGEADAVKVLEVRFRDFLGLLELARNDIDQGHREAALVNYKAASDIRFGRLNNIVLQAGRSPEEILAQDSWAKLDPRQAYLGLDANIAKLTTIKTATLEEATAKSRREDSLLFAIVLITIVFLLIPLVFLNLRYALVTHRIINPGYVLATVLTLVMLIALFFQLGNARRDYTTVAEDTFKSMEAASQAKQALLDSRNDGAQLLISPQGSSLDTSNTELTSNVKDAFNPANFDSNFKTRVDRFRKQLDIAWQGVSYPGERKALCAVEENPLANGRKCEESEKTIGPNGRTLPGAWPVYLGQKDFLLTNFNRGLVAEAIKIGYGPFNQWAIATEEGLTELVKVNRQNFDAAACDAIGRNQFGNNCGGSNGYLNFLLVICSIIFPTIALSTLGGAWITRQIT